MNESHLHNTIAYIHRNPVKAKIVDKMDDYIYSSYNFMKSGNLDDKHTKLLFWDRNYLDDFKQIHTYYNENDILEIKEEKISIQLLKNFVDLFFKQNNTTIDQLKKDKYLLTSLVSAAKNKYTVTNKQLTELLKIGKNRITNLKRDFKSVP